METRCLPKFYRRVRLRAHFHTGEASEAQATPDTCDPFHKLHNEESTWTPPEGKFTAIDHYVDRCRRAVNALDFKTRTHQTILSPSQKQALLHLTTRDDIIIKPADKGGAVVVWSRPLYDVEAQRQLSDGRFYERLDHDPVKEYQQVLKTAVKQMIQANELPASAENLILQTQGRHVFIFYQRCTRRTILEDQLFQRVIAQARTLRLTLTWLFQLSYVILKHTSRALTMHFKSLELFSLPTMTPANASTIQWTSSPFTPLSHTTAV